MTFHEKLVKLRKLKGLTQDEFASAVGVSRQAVYKWECGQSYPEASKLVEIKLLFSISIDDLLDDSYEVIVPEKKKKRVKKAEAAALEAQVQEQMAKEEKGVEPIFDEPKPAEKPAAKPVEEKPVEEKPAETPVAQQPVAEKPVEEKKKPEIRHFEHTIDGLKAPKSGERVSLWEKIYGTKKQ